LTVLTVPFLLSKDTGEGHRSSADVLIKLLGLCQTTFHDRNCTKESYSAFY